MIISSLAFS